MKTIRSFVLWWLAASVLLVSAVRAQDNAAPAGAPAAPPPFTAQELDSILAPIALYPDSLLSQVLMASTYPLEVVQAARWSKANPKLSGDEAVKKVGNESWDVSVMSLVAFPNILEMMNEKLDWTQKLGDAFLGQQGDVMASIQRLRHLAQNAGNLQSNEQQVVRSEAQAIIIEPAQPQTIYVPAYNPTVVYGAWPYPAYPPYYYPGVAMWYPGAALVRGFAWGVGFAAAGAIFGNCNWGRGNVNVNVNRATNINRNYNRTSVGGGGNWQHNPQHRGNVGYRDQGSRERYGDGRGSGADSRRDYRGRDGERGGSEAQVRQPVAIGALAIIIALGGCAGQNFDLAVIQPKAAVDRQYLRLDGAFIGQEYPRRAAFDDRRCYRGAINVRKRLCGEDDGRVLLPKRLQPFPELPRKILVIEGKPTFIDNKECRPAVETAPDAMEEVRQHGRRSTRSNQTFGLKRLDRGFAKALEFGVEQAPGRSAEAIRLQGAFQRVRLEQD